MGERTYSFDTYIKPWYGALIEPSRLLFYGVLAWSAWLQFYTLTEHFQYGIHGTNAGYMCLSARNWVRHGLWNLKFYQITDGGPLVAGSQIYTHHPPLVPLLVWFWFWISGSFSEWCARIVPVAFSLSTLVLLYVIVRRVWGERLAGLAAFCYALMPYTTYFATNVCYETGDQFFCLLILYWYLRYMESQRFAHFAWMCGGLVLGSLNDWPAFFTVPLLGLHWFFRFPGRRRLYCLLYPALAVSVLLLFLFSIAYAEGTWRISPINALLRMDPDSHGIPEAGLTGWLRVVGGEHLGYFGTGPVVLLTVLWVGGFLLRWARRQASEPDFLVVILLSYGLMHIVLGYGWAYGHNYWSSLMAPGMALAAAITFDNFFQRLEARPVSARGVWRSLFYAGVLAFGLFSTVRFFHLRTPHDPTAYQLAATLRENTQFEDHILTTIDMDANFMLLRFYSDRNMIFGIHYPNQFADLYNQPYQGVPPQDAPSLATIRPRVAYGQSGPTYRYFFLPDEDKPWHAPLYDFLKATYRTRTVPGFTIFDLKDPLVSDEELRRMLAGAGKDAAIAVQGATEKNPL